MTDVFVSYSSKDKSAVAVLVSELEAAGVKIWWDDHLRAGAQFTAELNRQLQLAKCVIVVWSGNSVNSEWVHEEASYAKDKRKIVPIRLDGFDVSDIPVGFRTLHTLLFESRRPIMDAIRSYGVDLRIAEASAESTIQASSAGATTASVSVPGFEGVPIATIRERAEAGDAAAMAELAYRHLSGTDVPYDPARALDLMQRSAATGHPAGLVALSGAKFAGVIVAADPEESQRLVERAVAAGYGPAKALRAMYVFQGVAGYGKDEAGALATLTALSNENLVDAVDGLASCWFARASQTKEAADGAEALRWAKRASEAGRGFAHAILGLCHASGIGTPVDRAAAVEIWRKGAELGDEMSMTAYADALLDGQHVERNEIEALTLLGRAAKRGHGRAETLLGLLYLTGNVVAKDVTRAVGLLESAVSRGENDAAAWLGSALVIGTDVPADHKRGFKLLQEAYDKGFRIAATLLARCYREGLGTKVDKPKAIRIYREAAKEGDPDAQNSLGMMYLNGEGITADNKLAVKWIERAADQKHVLATANLACMYAFGQGIERDDDKAEYWFRIAEEVNGEAVRFESLRQLLAEGNEPDADSQSMAILRAVSGVDYINSKADIEKLPNAILYALDFWWRRSGHGSLKARDWVYWTGTYSGKEDVFSNSYLDDHLGTIGIGAE